jgi:hypothetical protein
MKITPCFEVLAHLVVDDLRLVLGADAGQNLRPPRDAEPSKVFLMSSGTSSQRGCSSRGADEVVDVLPVIWPRFPPHLGVGAPGSAQGLEAELSIQSGSDLYPEMSRTTCSESPFGDS